MKNYKRLTNNNRDEYDPEYDFCCGCKYFGKPGCNRPNGTCGNYERFIETYNRLEELEDKIEQGYIKILPVKAGDKIYVVPSKAIYGINRMHKTFREINRVYTQTVDEIRFFKDGMYMVYSCEYQQNHLSEFFGETWFLEYEQAANRLKEMEAIYAKYD